MQLTILKISSFKPRVKLIAQIHISEGYIQDFNLDLSDAKFSFSFLMPCC